MKEIIFWVVIGTAVGLLYRWQPNAAAVHDAFTSDQARRLVQAQEAIAAAACATLKKAPGGAFPVQCEVYVGSLR